jgi:hypothetical protein
MKKSCLEKWLEALRSQKYKKVRGALRVGDCYCALGVLCDISELGSWEQDPYSNKMVYLNQVNYLPQKVREWAGISDSECSSITAFLIVHNDNLKMDFTSLANELEKKFKKTKT